MNDLCHCTGTTKLTCFYYLIIACFYYLYYLLYYLKAVKHFVTCNYYYYYTCKTLSLNYGHPKIFACHPMYTSLESPLWWGPSAVHPACCAAVRTSGHREARQHAEAPCIEAPVSASRQVADSP